MYRTDESIRGCGTGRRTLAALLAVVALLATAPPVAAEHTLTEPGVGEDALTGGGEMEGREKCGTLDLVCVAVGAAAMETCIEKNVKTGVWPFRETRTFKICGGLAAAAGVTSAFAVLSSSHVIRAKVKVGDVSKEVTFVEMNQPHLVNTEGFGKGVALGADGGEELCARAEAGASARGDATGTAAASVSAQSDSCDDSKLLATALGVADGVLGGADESHRQSADAPRAVRFAELEEDIRQALVAAFEDAIRLKTGHAEDQARRAGFQGLVEVSRILKEDLLAQAAGYDGTVLVYRQE